MARMLWIAALGCLAAASASAADPDEGAASARKLWQVGKYDEAIEAYDALLARPDNLKPEQKAALVLGRVEAWASTGQVDKAKDALKALSADQPRNADAPARLGMLLFDRGDWTGAAAAAKAATDIDADHLLGRWVGARLAEGQGRQGDALDAWKWFVDSFNADQDKYIKNADALLVIGQAAEKYYKAKARGEELSETLNDVINEIYEAALKADPKCWQAPLMEARLFLSGYSEGAARKELQRANKINPRAPEVIVTLGQSDLQGYKLAAGREKADMALEINPKYGPAFVLKADVNISDERFAEALDSAKKALGENPKDEDALARLAASYRLLVDPAGALATESVALSNSPRPATFYSMLGERLADRRKYPEAERAFLLAARADPERADNRIGLGMLYMQIGREVEARDLFDAAFAADPFNVRADNMRKVLKHMAGYRPIESPRYSVAILPGRDALLGKYMSRYLEETHDELAKRFGYSPPGLTKIEIMKDHAWFSGRTIGLPFIPTVGACTGKVVALASPGATQKPFNWARVLKHEVVHVITLQQTEFNIPHWYTEALAVESEGFPRPQPWNKLLQERVPARKLLNLDNINLGFIRPEQPDDRQMAYCQAQLYAQYMLKRFGDDALMKMLDAYRRGMTTEKAIGYCFKVEKKDFEAKYLEFLDGVVKTIKTRVSEEKPVSFSELERKLAAKPDDAELNARMAYEHFARRDLKAARPLADKALKLKPKQPLASYVKARLLVTIGDDDAAREVLVPAFDEADPDERVVDLLAELQMKAGNLDEAARLYEIAHKGDPFHTKWIASLARVHLRQKDEPKFLADLAMLADSDADDLGVRKALAERHLASKAWKDAGHWAMECLFVDVNDPIGHVVLADASAGQEKYKEAIEEYEVALTLKPKKPADLKVRLAKAQQSMGALDAARTTVDAILKADPEHPGALELSKALKDK
jgi:tetratricopeptide (TPR) repeat protein